MDGEKKPRAYRVLIIEDQEMFASYLEQVLTQRGYQTVSFQGAFQALDYFVKNAAQVDLILTDVVMPHMDGIELARRVGKMRPETPVILLSAYSVQLAEGAALPNVRAVLHKPVLKSELLATIEGVVRSREKQSRRITA